MPRISTRSRKPNLIAATVLAMTAGVLYANFDPVPAGEAPATASDHESSTDEEFIVPMPPEAANLPVVEVTADAPDGTQSPEPNLASTLNNLELIEYAMFLLKDGAEFLKQYETYTTVFRKQERLGGDLSEVQTIDVKIRHSTPFAVYMKWRNGDRGRQLLYSDEYKDGDMVVKLGGFKGRLIPGIKLNPLGSRALEESRHPVTQAGILGMVEQMIVDRSKELSEGHGVCCSKLPNQEFDERDCFCFVFEYDTPQDSGKYRKRVIVLDAERHIPVLARNYTWTAEPSQLTAEELDALTLVENYSFTKTDFSKTLTAIEFSRENPRYRM
jgi:hypothetical protein